MLTMHIDIHQDNHQGETQARGVVAALVAIYGPSVLPATAHYTAPASQVIAQSLNRSEWATPAPDGYPSDEQIEAQATAAVQAISEVTGANGLDFEAPSAAPFRDTAGIPWDERIHASTKTTNKDGTWTRRRNTPDEVFDKVMAELKAANTAMTVAAAAGLTAPAPEPPQPSAAEAFTPPPSVVIPAHVPTPPVPAVPAPPAPTVPAPPTVAAPAPPTVAAPAPPTVAAPDDTAAEPVEIMKAVNAKRVPADKLQEIFGKAGLDGLAKVFTAPIEARRIIAAELATL